MNMLTSRLAVIFGEPDSLDPAAYLAEIERLTSGYGDNVLADAADHVISTHRYRTWPTPAQCVHACHLTAEEHATRQPQRGKQYRFPSKRGPYAPETVAQWERAQAWRNSLPDDHPLARQGDAHNHRMKPLFRALFEAMQRNSRNQDIHRRPLSQASRRMTGEHNDQ